VTLDRPREAADSSACPDAERLAEYGDRRLPAPEQRDIDRHLVGCADCREALFIAAAFRDHDETQLAENSGKVLWFRHTWVKVGGGVLAAAAGLLIAIYTGRVPAGTPNAIQGALGSPDLTGLVAAVGAAPTRLIDGRLTGGFEYGPPPSVTRGAPASVSTDVQIAAASVELRVGESQLPRNLHALGVAALLLGDYDTAQKQLAGAASAEPSNPAFASDLAAVHLTRGVRTGDVAELRAAIAAADRALQLEPGLNEARFNRALALASLPAPDLSGLEDYAARDSGPWGDEARRRLSERKAPDR
jgi:tetratricopeptide (TPR) repeat protein